MCAVCLNSSRRPGLSLVLHQAFERRLDSPPSDTLPGRAPGFFCVAEQIQSEHDENEIRAQFNVTGRLPIAAQLPVRDGIRRDTAQSREKFPTWKTEPATQPPTPGSD
jgi:hypothetical protein